MKIMMPLPPTSSGTPHLRTIALIDMDRFKFRKCANSLHAIGPSGNIASIAAFCFSVIVMYGGNLQSQLSEFGRHTFAVSEITSESSVIRRALNCPSDKL